MLLVDSHYSLSRKLMLTGNGNPYKEGTFEGFLVDYIMNSCSPDMSGFVSNHDLLNKLGKANFTEQIDICRYDKIVDYAIFLSRNANVVKILKKKDSNRKIFGVYLEDGLVNLLEKSDYTDYLNEMSNDERRLSLYQVLYVNRMIREQFKIPTISNHNGNLNEINIKLNNFHYHDLHHLNEVKLPIMSWCHPYPNENWTAINTRGLFHHVGDHAAFIMAAVQYGDCYVVGKDEMGDLIILGTVTENETTSFKLYDRVNALDFDYIYGVAKGDSIYMTKMNYLNIDDNDCKMNTKENARLIEEIWDNKVFCETAKRKIAVCSFSEMLEVLIKKQMNIIKQKTPSLHSILDYTQNNDFSENNPIMKLVNQIKKIPTIQIDDMMNFELYVNDNKYYSDDVRSDLLYLNKNNSTLLDDLFKAFKDIENSFYLVKHHEKITFKVKNNQLSIKSNKLSLKEKQILLSYVVELAHTLILIKKEFKELYNRRKFQKIKEQAIQESSLFYKTVANKVDCQIINPPSKELGLFLKEQNQKKIYWDMVSVFESVFPTLVLQNNSPNLEFKTKMATDLFVQITKVVDYEQSSLYSYWKDLDNKAFIISELIDMKNEYRIFVINNKPVAGTPCFRNSTPFDAWQNGRFDPRLCHGHNADELKLTKETRNRVSKYAKFANYFAKEMKRVHPETSNYVLDVAWSDDVQDVVPIELNSITWSGGYQINMNRICAAVAEKPYHYEDNNNNKHFSHFILKEKAWKEMKENNLIIDEKYNLNGLERTGHEKLLNPEIESDILTIDDLFESLVEEQVFDKVQEKK